MTQPSNFGPSGRITLGGLTRLLRSVAPHAHGSLALCAPGIANRSAGALCYAMTDLEIITALDEAVADPRVTRHVTGAVPTLELRLRLDPDAIMAWEPIPLETYGRPLPPEIRSS